MSELWNSQPLQQQACRTVRLLLIQFVCTWCKDTISYRSQSFLSLTTGNSKDCQWLRSHADGFLIVLLRFFVLVSSSWNHGCLAIVPGLITKCSSSDAVNEVWVGKARSFPTLTCFAPDVKSIIELSCPPLPCGTLIITLWDFDNFKHVSCQHMTSIHTLLAHGDSTLDGYESNTQVRKLFFSFLPCFYFQGRAAVNYLDALRYFAPLWLTEEPVPKRGK